MSTPLPQASRGECRSWLKMTIESGALDRIPSEYDPLGVDTYDYARELLAGLRTPETPGRAPAELIAAVLDFRRWVNARQQTSRRILLAEAASDRDTFELEDPIAPRPAKPRALPRLSPPPRRRRPELDPMWDEDLDSF